MTLDDVSGGTAPTPAGAVPRTLEVASWLLYAAAGLIALVAVWTLFGLPGPLQAVPEDAATGGRVFYVFTLLLPIAALHFFAGRWAVAGRLRGLIVGTLLAVLMSIGSAARSIFAPLPEDGEPLSTLTQTMGTLYLLTGLAIIVLLWVPPSVKYAWRRHKERREAMD